MSSTITVPAAGAAPANLRTLATQAKADVEALQSGTSSTGVNGTSIAAGGALVAGQVLRATGAAAAGWGAVDLANVAAVTGTLPGANVQAASTSNQGAMTASQFTLLLIGDVGLVHGVRGIVTADVADLGAFTVAGHDGLTFVENDRVGLVNQTNGLDDGVYVVGVVALGVAALTRAADWAQGVTLRAGSSMRASEGTTWKHVEWIARVAGDITVGLVAPDFYPTVQSGTTAAMAGTPGTINVPNLWILSTNQAVSRILYSVNTPGGTRGFLSAPTAARTAGAGTGEFDVDSDANETSTIDWIVMQ